MLHLIERLVPARVQRALMPLAHRVRHRWRRWRGVPIAGVNLVLTNAAGEILLLRHSYGPKVWALPGGGLKPGEDPAAAARREVDEELGVSLDGLETIGTLEERLSGVPHTAHLFTAMCDRQPEPDGREVIEARFFALQSLPDRLGDISKRRIAIYERFVREERTGG